METENIKITEPGWQDVATVGGVTLTNGDTYTITLIGNVGGEVCIATSTPDDGFKGHPVSENVNFSFTYVTGEKIWVKVSPQLGNAIVVIS